MTHRFYQFEPFKGDLPARLKGSMVSMEQGQALPFAIDRLQDRGKFFIDPGEQIYVGMVLGEHSRDNDLEINVIKVKN